ncbi:MAG: HIT domain-containing protein [Betaproteobacteria bacterium]|nr:HIT domain-containing protein [Betaproteobacteria bacterium]
MSCELCAREQMLIENTLAYARYDSNSLCRGHVLVVPKRHVASFFELNSDEHGAINALLCQAQALIQAEHAPDGYNIGVNVGKAAGQARMHVHVHLIPRYTDDVPDPRGGDRYVLAGRRPDS